MKKLLSELFILIFLGTVIFAETKKGTVLDDRVRVRSAPSLKYSNIVGVVNKGDALEVDAKTDYLDNIDGFSKTWYRVNFSNQEYWIYGGYFSVDSNAEYYLEELSKSRAMGYALLNYNVKFVADCGDYLRKGKNVKKTYESFKVEGGYEINAICYNFEYGSVIIDCYTLDDTQFTWTSTSIVKNCENPLNLKLDMTMEEVKAVFGEFDYIEANKAFIYGGGIRAEFIFNKNRLERINLVTDGC